MKLVFVALISLLTVHLTDHENLQVCVHSSRNSRGVLVMETVYKAWRIENKIGVPLDERRFLRSFDSGDLPQAIKYITGKKNLPDLPTSLDSMDRMARARYLLQRGYSGEFLQAKTGPRFDHIVKGAEGYGSLFKQLGDFARKAKANNAVEDVDRDLNDLADGVKDAWHARRADGQRFVLKSLKKTLPTLDIKTAKETWSDGSTYERWDKEATLKANPTLAQNIRAWEAKYPKEKGVPAHQAAITAQQKALAEMGQKCSKDKLPLKRSLAVFDATEGVEDLQEISELLERV